MRNFTVILFCIFLIYGCDNNVSQKSKIVEITQTIEIGSVPEHIIDMELWDGKLLMGCYYWKNSGDGKVKIYAHDINGSGIYSWQIFPKNYESIYRIWVRDNAVLNISTEQPPEHLAREKVAGWGLQKSYNSFGWALLGDTLSNGKSVRGFSTEKRSTPGIIEVFENGSWHQLGNILKGKDGSNRITWCMDYFNGTYYAGTSLAENGGYKSHDCGNIYKLENNNWVPIYGNDSGKPCGGVVSCLTADNRIFFGTGNPQKVLIFDGSNWSEFMIDEAGEVSKIWKDSTDHIFAGCYTSQKVLIYQWNLKTKQFELIFETPTNTPYYQWGVVGVCVDNGIMFMKHRDGNISRVKKLLYREK